MATRGDEAPDPAAAAIWGLIRSAQSEHPGRFSLVDTDGTEASQQALPAALAIGIEEPQLALRDGVALVPRAAGWGEDTEEESRPIDPEGTVLITGATGALGALTARHMVERHDARHLLLVSRTGPDAEGAGELKGELEALGAEVTIAACDVADREALAVLLAAVPEAHPLGAVIHCAGVLADGTVEAMGPEQIERVFVPKVDAAWNLHELRRASISRRLSSSHRPRARSAAPARPTTPPPTSSSTRSPRSGGRRVCPRPRSPGGCGSGRAA